MSETTYIAPTNPGTVLGRHALLRVTFAEEPHWFVPDHVAALNFKAQVDRLIAQMEGGGFQLAPASDTHVPSGMTTWTIDFIAPSGYAVVGQAVTQLDENLKAGWVLNSNAYVARVERITGAQAGEEDAGEDRAGTAITLEEQLQETAFGQQLAKWFGRATVGLIVIGGITLAVIYAPEIKTALRIGRRVTP